MRWTFVLVVVLTVAYVGVRAPHYSQVLLGEEGCFAKVFFDHPTGPCYIIEARMDGKEYFAPVQHPGMMSELFGLLGRLTCWVQDCRAFSELRATTTIRVVFSLFHYIGVLLLVLLLSYENVPRLPLLFLLIVAALVISPLAVSASLTIHLDGTYGMLMSTLVGLAFFRTGLWERRNVFARGVAEHSTTPQGENHSAKWYGGRLLTCAAGYLLGLLGKTPWTLALVAAVCASFLWSLVFVETRAGMRRDLPYVLGGCLLGNVCSYLFDPLNFILGWCWSCGLAYNHNVLAGGISTLLDLTLKRLPFMCTHLLLLGLMVWGVLREGIRNTPHWLVFNCAFACALFFSFFINTWNEEPRYFAPSLAALTVAAVGVLMRVDTVPQTEDRQPASSGVNHSQTEQKRSARVSWVVGAVVVFMTVHAAGFFLFAHVKKRSVTMFPGLAELSADREAWRKHVPPDGNCLPRLDTAVAYREYGVDFMGSSVGSPYADDLARKHGKVLCDP